VKYIALLCCVLLIGCSSSYRVRTSGDQSVSTQEILSRYLDRSGSWQSFSSQVKMKVEIGDSSFSAKGILFYTSPEKYSLSFGSPYNQVLGDIYVTPEQLLYWGNGRSQMVFLTSDTVHIQELIPFTLPDWDPRDLLPFPICGRTAGFQVIKEATDSLGQRWVHGECGSALHDVLIDSEMGTIMKEIVARHGTDAVYKSYKRNRSINGWPVSTRTICTDASRRVRLTWVLSDIVLKGAEFISGSEETSPLLPSDHE
jgi:hypothetical protein